MKKTTKRLKRVLKNNKYIGNMADFSSPIKVESPIHFDGIDEPVRRRYSLEEMDIDWDNSNNLESEWYYS